MLLKIYKGTYVESSEVCSVGVSKSTEKMKKGKEKYTVDLLFKNERGCGWDFDTEKEAEDFANEIAKKIYEDQCLKK